MSTALAVRDESSSLDIYMDKAKFDQAMAVARTFSESSLVPKHFQGEGNVANCLIALQFCFRAKLDPFMGLQRLYIVHGKMGMEAQLAIALMNGSGVFSTPIQWRWDDQPGDKRRCYAYATHAKTGQVIEAWCSMELARAEGWYGKDGSKWKTMPEQMSQYRAATFLGRLYCPEVLMGLSTREELLDLGEAEVVARGTSAASLDAALSGDEVPAKVAEIVSQPTRPAQTVSEPFTTQEPTDPEKPTQTAPIDARKLSREDIKEWMATLSAEDKDKFRETAKSYGSEMSQLDAARLAYVDMQEKAV